MLNEYKIIREIYIYYIQHSWGLSYLKFKIVRFWRTALAKIDLFIFASWATRSRAQIRRMQLSEYPIQVGGDRIPRLPGRGLSRVDRGLSQTHCMCSFDQCDFPQSSKLYVVRSGLGLRGSRPDRGPESVGAGLHVGEHRLCANAAPSGNLWQTNRRFFSCFRYIHKTFCIK